MRGATFPGKGSPSSGFLGVYMMLQMCDHLDVYGMAQGGLTSSWHYFQVRNHSICNRTTVSVLRLLRYAMQPGTFKASREFGGTPHHSFDLERDLMQVILLHVCNSLLYYGQC